MLSGLAPYIIRHKKQWIWGLIVVFLGVLASLLGPPVFIRYAIDALTAGTNAGQILLFAALTIGSSIVANVLFFAMRRLIIVASRQMTAELRSDLFAKLSTLDQSYFHRVRVGDLMNRFISDISAIQEVFGFSLLHGVSNGLRLIISLIVILSLSLPLGLLLLGALPLITIFVIWMMSLIDRLYTAMQEQASVLAAKAQENFANIRVIKGYAIENREILEFKSLNDEYRRRVLRLQLVDGPAWASLEFLLGVIFAVGLMIAAKPIVFSELSLGQFVQFSTYLFNLTWPLFSIGEIVGNLQRGMSSWQRLAEIFKTKTKIDDSQANLAIKELKGTIEFKKVSLELDGRKLLDEIDLLIPAGQVLGITGRTGSGKSLMSSLITRQIDPTSGHIFVDGQVIKSIPLDILRQNIGLVMQEPFLFSETIKENIAFGLKDADFATVYWAAKVANLTKDVESFEKGFETMLGERGVTLSGGQRQRTALARAIAKKPTILILDDALSAVDTETESEILHELRQVFPGRTVILISHRISTLRQADQIIVLAKGCIAEKGTHQELLEKKGLYAKIEEQQRLQNEVLSA